jgi:hypothetical protein
MDNAIKDMKTWAEANTWLERHGYGIEQIRQQKELWDAVAVPAAPVAKVATAPVAKVATAPVAKVMPTSKPKS